MRARSCVVSTLFLLATGCGRAHQLEEGGYVFTIPAGGVFRDDCGLAADGGPALQAQVDVFGDDIRLAMVQQAGAQCLSVELVGQYQFDNENFFADGTATNPPLEANGEVCQVNFVQFHLDATTVETASFSGAMRISYLASSPIACTCQFWFNYTATACAPTGCPPVPTECS